MPSPWTSSPWDVPQRDTLGPPDGAWSSKDRESKQENQMPQAHQEGQRGWRGSRDGRLPRFTLLRASFAESGNTRSELQFV